MLPRQHRHRPRAPPPPSTTTAAGRPLTHSCLRKRSLYGFPFKRPFNDHHRIVGACNGVVCVSDDQAIYVDSTYLWNPAKGEHLALPEPRVTYYSHGPFDHILGFGFDEVSRDFKVVRVVHLDTGFRVPPEIDVYRLSTRPWHNISDSSRVECRIGKRQGQVYLNGRTHWLAMTKDGVRVISFYMRDERFRYKGLPWSIPVLEN